MAPQEDLKVDKPKRILIVDDVEQNRKLLESILKSLGYESETARDGVGLLHHCRGGMRPWAIATF